MELLLWDQLLRNPASQQIMTISADLMSQLSKALSLGSIQVSSVHADSIVLLCYLLLAAGKMTAARMKVLAALLASLVVAYSPIYNSLSDVGYYCALSMVYITAASYVTNKQIKYTLVIMSIFELLMAVDSYVNPTTETWLFRNFEEVTLLIHALIVSSCYRLKPIDLGTILGRFINSLRGLAHSNCLTSSL